MGKRMNSFLPVCPGQVPLWTPVCDWAALPTVPQTAGEGREGRSALVCTQLAGFLQASQPLWEDSTDRTQCPQGHSGPSHPRGHHSLPQLAAELTLPRPCLCGSAPAPSIDQSVPAKSKRRPSQGGKSQAEAPQMHPCSHTYLVLVIYNGESKHRHHS